MQIIYITAGIIAYLLYELYRAKTTKSGTSLGTALAIVFYLPFKMLREIFEKEKVELSKREKRMRELAKETKSKIIFINK